MLVLKRKAGESIAIGADIKVVVVRILEGKVQLGIEAPPHVHILRAELDVRDEAAA